MQTYHRNGISFAYPEDWTLEENSMNTNEGNVTLSNEFGSFWTLQKYPKNTNPEIIIWEAAATMQSEYADIECDQFAKVIAGKNVIGFEMTFFYLDLMNTAMVLCLEENGAVFSIFWQTSHQLMIAGDQTESIEKTMEEITNSFLQVP